MSLSIDEATHHWGLMAEMMEAFLDAWADSDSRGIPELVEFLPTEQTPLRAMVAVELVKIDMEQRHAQGIFRSLEWYFDAVSDLLEDGEPPVDLIYEEYQVRKSGGDKFDASEYFTRFPKNRPALERMLNCCKVQHTTSLAAGLPKVIFKAGDVVDDFELLTRLGEGAFATVFLARQKSMQRLVALKVSADRGNEPQTLAQLEHQHIVRVYDQRCLPEHKIRLLYMQYAPGGTLHDVVARVRRTLPPDRTGRILLDTVHEALDRSGYPAPESPSLRKRLGNASWAEVVCRMGVQLAQALDYAHHRGILHRDVKPANVLLTGECTPKLADFNISFSSQLDGASPAAYFGGSLAYMSPEQLEACNAKHERSPDSLDGRSDLYSLAAMLWELLYGDRPFREEGLSTSWTESLVEMTHRRRTEKPSIPASARDDLTREITKILQHVLSPEAETRPANGEEFARELALCLHPQSKKLLEAPTGGMRRFIRAWPISAITFAVIAPNALAGIFNYFYNRAWVVNDTAEIAEHRISGNLFDGVCLALNTCYFSFGAILVYILFGRLAWMIRATVTGKSLKGVDIAELKVQSMQLAHTAAILATILWLTSGFTFPATLKLFGADLSREAFQHFFAAMAVCGLIAAAYPFFGVTYLMTHYLYPALLNLAPGESDEQIQLSALTKRLTFYRVVAAAVPSTGLLMLVTFNGRASAAPSDLVWWAQVGLILVGIAGSLFLEFLNVRIRNDIAALLAATHPLDLTRTGTESLESM